MFAQAFVNVTDGCIYCGECTTNGHVAIDGAPDENHAPGHGLHIECEGFTACTEHGICGGLAAFIGIPETAERQASMPPSVIDGKLNAVRVAWMLNDNAELRRLIQAHRGIVFNRHRSAVQVIGCGGLVVAHFRVSARDARLIGD
jgi:hypothetical protein